MSDYKDVLHKWAIEFIKKHRSNLEPVEILKVNFEEYEAAGYCETCWSPAYTAIEISYKDSSGVRREFYETSDEEEGFKMGTILSELFRIAEEEDNLDS